METENRSPCNITSTGTHTCSMCHTFHLLRDFSSFVAILVISLGQLSQNFLSPSTKHPSPFSRLNSECFFFFFFLKTSRTLPHVYFQFPHSFPSSCCSVAKSCLTLCDPMGWSMHQPSLTFAISQSLFKLISIESVMPPNHLILCCPLLLLPSIFPSIRVFSNQLALHIRWPKYWGFSFSISPTDENIQV